MANLKDGFDGKPGWGGEKKWISANKKLVIIVGFILVVILAAVLG